MTATPHLLSSYAVPVPGILYGTAWKAGRTAALVEQAISLGFRGFDTACQPKHYHEPGVGVGLAAGQRIGLTRSEIYLQTKFTPVDGHDPTHIPYDPRANLSDQVEQSFAASLRNLGTDYLDGLILHSPLANERDLLEVWRAMETLFDSGGTRQLGISNCYALSKLERLYAQARIKPAIVQNRFHAATGYDSEIREFCRQQGILYQSFWTLTANHGILAHPTVQQLANHYQRSPAQVWFRFLTQLGIIPLTGTSSPTHMQEDLAIFAFELSAAECGEMARLLR